MPLVTPTDGISNSNSNSNNNNNVQKRRQTLITIISGFWPNASTTKRQEYQEHFEDDGEMFNDCGLAECQYFVAGRILNVCNMMLWQARGKDTAQSPLHHSTNPQFPHAQQKQKQNNN
ncbi:hypothetical protein ACLKA6_016661 [Drosophila palustris]